MIIVDRKSRAKSIKITYNPTSINFAGIIWNLPITLRCKKLLIPTLNRSIEMS